jgi:spoIIIJ-associated protein
VASLVDEAFGLEKPAETHPAEAVATGKEALRRIIDFITSGAEIHVEAGEDRILFNVEGGNAGVLIGKRGQTLEAIQYLVEKIVNRQSDTRIRIQIDVEGYLNNRRENLKNLARKLSEKAKSTGKPATIGQMNAHDRRIIHLTLKNDQGVRTQSIGDGFYRKLVIFPKKRRKKQNL